MTGQSSLRTHVTALALLAGVVLSALCTAPVTAAGPDPYYKVPPIFFPCPNSIGNKSVEREEFRTGRHRHHVQAG
jgi:hypothetical protein